MSGSAVANTLTRKMVAPKAQGLPITVLTSAPWSPSTNEDVRAAWRSGKSTASAMPRRNTP